MAFKSLFKDRLVWSLLLAVALITGFAALRPPTNHGLYRETFWCQKAHWQHCADIVITGDSRVGMGVSPAALAASLPESMRIYNYGFNANGYSAAYLTAVESLLDPQSKNPTIILGVTPRSLTDNAAGRNFFTVYRKKSPWQCWANNHLTFLLRHTDTLGFSDVRRRLFDPEKALRMQYEYYPDGWIAVDSRRDRPESKLDNYIREFKDNPVDPAVVDDLMKQTRAWTDSHIRVFAFRVPSCPQMVEIENTYSGFDESAFRARFEAAGGRWIPLDQSAYHTFDGSHLTRDGAEKLSHDLAHAL
ncbi:MAG: hypothetical protein JW709_10905 [Sedimentisphaerales bacterium]|nr:hypothetical protein [Sedimentisphaerales bacterium]